MYSASVSGVVASVGNPISAAVDTIGNIYISGNTDHTVRVYSTSGKSLEQTSQRRLTKIDVIGVLTVLAGQVNTPGAANGLGTNAQFHTPNDIAVSTNGNLLVSENGNSYIRVVTTAGTVRLSCIIVMRSYIHVIAGRNGHCLQLFIQRSHRPRHGSRFDRHSIWG
jgi:hypothetical protein